MRSHLTPFNLENGPLIRVHMMRVSDDEHIIAFSAHHLICDGWSWSVLLEEISVVYSALVQDKEITLDQAPRFSEYVQFELDRLEEEETEASYAYWEDQFKVLPATLELPLDRPRPSFKSFKGGTFQVQVRRERL